MAKGKWGDRIPQVKEVAENGRLVERWVVDGKIVGGRGVVNCAAVMDDPLRRTFPQRWEDVPAKVYDPLERLKALDSDRVDAEVLFFNDPINSAALPFQGDPAFELSCVQAYNDALAEWRDISERYIPLAIIPYGSDIRTITREVERAVSRGHKGIVMVAEPSMAGNGLKHLNDPYWDTLWDTAQELNIPINWHAHAGIKLLPDKWQSHQAMRRTAAFSVQPQLIPNLILSGLADRYPRLKWVCAETGMGWLAYLIQACDYLWERKQLWREGVTTRPSEVFKRQIYVTFWYEREGISMRSFISPENIMWASDYPHATSTYPNSWEAVDAVIKHVDEADKGKLLWENAARLYKLMEYAKDTVGVA